MSIDFSIAGCKDVTVAKLFGICDDGSKPKERAYLDTLHGATWIAVVDNGYGYNVTFTAIDNCIPIIKDDGTMSKRCDGMLSYNGTLIFLELKERAQLGSSWIIDAELQLRTTIDCFEKTQGSEGFEIKKAYAANSEHPKFRTNQIQRMEKFYLDTGYIFRIENRIVLV